jgi:hypothetical protein
LTAVGAVGRVRGMARPLRIPVAGGWYHVGARQEGLRLAEVVRGVPGLKYMAAARGCSGLRHGWKRARRRDGSSATSGEQCQQYRCDPSAFARPWADGETVGDGLAELVPPVVAGRRSPLSIPRGGCRESNA